MTWKKSVRVISRGRNSRHKRNPNTEQSYPDSYKAQMFPSAFICLLSITFVISFVPFGAFFGFLYDSKGLTAPLCVTITTALARVAQLLYLAEPTCFTVMDSINRPNTYCIVPHSSIFHTFYYDYQLYTNDLRIILYTALPLFLFNIIYHLRTSLNYRWTLAILLVQCYVSIRRINRNTLASAIIACAKFVMTFGRTLTPSLNTQLEMFFLMIHGDMGLAKNIVTNRLPLGFGYPGTNPFASLGSVVVHDEFAGATA